MSQNQILIDRFLNHQDLHQSLPHSKSLADIGWTTEKINKKDQIFFRPFGPINIAKFQRPETLDLEAVDHFRKKHKTLTLYLEPKKDSGLPKNIGFKSTPFAHSSTSLIDLTLKNEGLLATFNQNTRRNLRSSNTDLTVKSIPLADLTQSHILDLYTLQDNWYKQKKALTYPKEFLNSVLSNYKGHGHLHFAYYQNTPCAFLLTLYWDRVATYYLACANTLGYKIAAPTKLTWEAFQVSKQEGCEIFDFGGIYDPRYPKLYKNWQGFTKFKEGFRPTFISYPETRLLFFW